MTEVTMPAAVCTSISESTSPSTISLMVPLNWLRTLMALMVMVFLLGDANESFMSNPDLLRTMFLLPPPDAIRRNVLQSPTQLRGQR
ncbi:hypothetical protein FQZ97_1129630 [compost metagenome]